MDKKRENGHTMYKTIIFDLDGTLLDTLDDLTAAVNFALAEFSLPMCTREEVRGFVGNGIAKLMERAVGEENLEKVDFEKVLSSFKEYYKEHCADYTRPYENVLALLQTLQEKGVQRAVLSNKADFAVKMLAKEYFKDLLQEAVGENEEAGIRKKPAPDSLFAVMEKLGAKPEETVYVGDSEVDIQTAENGGVDCISVTWGFKDESFLKEHGAKILIDTPMDILKFV